MPKCVDFRQSKENGPVAVFCFKEVEKYVVKRKLAEVLDAGFVLIVNFINA